MDLLRIEEKNDFTVIYMSGRIDIIVAGEIEQRFNDLIAKGVKNYIIDLGDVDYFSSSAMRILIALKRMVQEKNGKLRLCRISKMVDKIMSALELIKVFDVFDDVEAAINAG